MINYKSYIVGSDQVWRDFFNNWARFSTFFLKFAEGRNARRVGYGISFGSDSWKNANINEQKKAMMIPLVKKFDRVSVRESSAIQMVQELEQSAVRVLDPTLLMTAEDYSALIDETPTADQRIPPIYCYILDQTPFKREIIEWISDEKDWETFGIFPNNGKPLPGPELWLKGFRDSRLVITDSFHGTVFAIINHTPFLVFANKARGVARMTELLDMLSIKERIIYNDTFDIRKVDAPIEWDKVDNKLIQLRKESAGWLISSLQ